MKGSIPVSKNFNTHDLFSWGRQPRSDMKRGKTVKITMMTGYFTPEQSADTHLNRDLLYGLGESGVDVTLITLFPTRGVSLEEQNRYLERADERISEHVRVIRIGKPGTYRKNLFRKGLNLMRKSWQLYAAARKTSPDIFLITSTPPFLGYAAALLSRNAPVVYKLQDMFPDSLVHSKGFSENNPLIRILRILEKWVYKRCMCIVAVSDDMKQTLISRGVPAEKITVIYEWIDEKQCVPIARKDNVLFDRFGLSRDGFYACYAGNIGLLQNVETIILASEILAKRRPEIQIVIIGNGAWEENMRAMLQASPHENVHCFPMQPLDQVSYVYSLGDVGLVSLKPQITKYALPSKTWSILSAGRPAVCEIDLDCALKKILEENRCGHAVSPGDAEALAQVLIDLYDRKEVMQQMGQAGRTFVEKKLTKEAAIEKYLKLLKMIMIKGANA